MARLASFEVNTVVHIATGATVMPPFRSSNAITRLERKALDHIFFISLHGKGSPAWANRENGKSTWKEQVK